MSGKLSRRYLFLHLLLLSACVANKKSIFPRELKVGVISYEEGEQTLKRFANFQNYLGEKTGAIIQVEPVYNENLAVERIQRNQWSLVFAPPGLAAMAIAHYQYLALLPLKEDDKSQSILIVRKDSPFEKLKNLQNQIVALGEPGSATGYYFPLYNLYGLTLAKILFAPTPKTVVEWVVQGKAGVGALSQKEFDLYSSQSLVTELRVLFSDPQTVPPAAVLIAPTIQRNDQDIIRQYLQQASTTLIQEIGYLPNDPAPDYRYMIAVVERVNRIASKLNSKPVILF